MERGIQEEPLEYGCSVTSEVLMLQFGKLGSSIHIYANYICLIDCQ